MCLPLQYLFLSLVFIVCISSIICAQEILLQSVRRYHQGLREGGQPDSDADFIPHVLLVGQQNLLSHGAVGEQRLAHVPGDGEGVGGDWWQPFPDDLFGSIWPHGIQAHQDMGHFAALSPKSVPGQAGRETAYPVRQNREPRREEGLLGKQAHVNQRALPG